jgi:hypothetical protein
MEGCHNARWNTVHILNNHMTYLMKKYIMFFKFSLFSTFFVPSTHSEYIALKHRLSCLKYFGVQTYQ